MGNLGSWDMKKAEVKKIYFFLPQSSMTSAPDTLVKSQKAKVGTECSLSRFANDTKRCAGVDMLEGRELF